MKNLLTKLAMAVLMTCPAFSQVVNPLENVLVLYNFNNLCSSIDPNTPAYCAPCVVATDLSLNHLTQDLHFSGALDDSKFRCFDGWDTPFEFNFSRADLSQVSNTLAFDMFVHPAEAVSITGLSLNWQRPYAGAVDSILAAVFWLDEYGVVQHRASDQISLTQISAWKSLEFSFTQGSAEFPTAPAGGGDTYHVELYAWGGQGGTLFLDNIALLGTCAPIPEPGTALLLGLAGSVLALHRRQRL